MQTRSRLANCTDELPLASPRCARATRRKLSRPGAYIIICEMGFRLATEQAKPGAAGSAEITVQNGMQ